MVGVIAEQNPYLSSGGFAPVYKDVTKGFIRGSKVIFPNDTLGDYFFLVMPNELTGAFNGMQQLTGRFVLVAVCKDANAFQMLDNMLFTLTKQLTCRMGGQLTIISSSLDSQHIISDVLGFDTTDKGMMRLKSTLISVTFDYTFTLTTNCIQNPCLCK